jgi:hypothetical protein
MLEGTFDHIASTILAPMIENTAIGTNWIAPYGLALLRSGDEAGATAVLDGFPDLAPDYFWISTMQLASELAAGLGRVDRCKAYFDDLLPHRHQLGIVASGSLCFGLVATTLGQLALAMGEPDLAVELLDEAVDRAVGMAAPYETVKARRCLAQALAATGEPFEELVALALADARRYGFADEEAALSSPA